MPLMVKLLGHYLSHTKIIFNKLTGICFIKINRYASIDFFFTPQMSAVSRLRATRQVVCTALRWHREDAGEKVKYSTYISFSNPI